MSIEVLLPSTNNAKSEPKSINVDFYHYFLDKKSTALDTGAIPIGRTIIRFLCVDYKRRRASLCNKNINVFLHFIVIRLHRINPTCRLKIYALISSSDFDQCFVIN